MRDHVLLSASRPLRRPSRAPRALRRAAALAALLAIGHGAAGASGAPAAPGPPSAITLSGGWGLRPDPSEQGLAHGWTVGRPALAWRAAAVPGVFDARPLPSLFAGTVGWYRLSFRGPSAPPGFAWALRFEQVRRTAQVWLNGRQLGRNDDPYAPFTLPATGLRAGALNTLVVRVDSRKGAEPREGWWNWGGITRAVSLVPEGPLVTSDPGLLPELRCTAPDVCRARVAYDARLTDRSAARITPSISVTLTAPSGSAVTRHTFTAAPLAPGRSERVRFEFGVAGRPDLWAPGHPALYDAQVQTLGGANVSQIDRLRIGLRSVAVHGGQLYLNDRRIRLSGASIEEDAPGHGPALSDADVSSLVRELQALHANTTRAQYPLDQRVLDRLDQVGILVWSQAPIYHRDELLHTAAQRRAALATLASSVYQTRDHPSVITHSVANELSPTADSTPGTRAYLDAAPAVVSDLDPTLPVSLDLLSYPGYPRQGTYSAYQLLGINNYFGWYAGRAPHSTADISGLAPYLRTMHAAYPNQGLVMTEFGAEATHFGAPDAPGTYAFQSTYVRRTLDIVAGLPFMNGSIYWNLREYAVKPYWYGGGGATVDLPRNSFHHKGLISYRGVPKPAFAVAGAMFTNTPLYVSAPTGHGPRRAGALAAAALALALALVAALDVWLFAGIRAAGRTGASGRVLALRPEEPAAQRNYA